MNSSESKSRKLVTVIPNLTEEQIKQIKEACDSAGFTALFFPDAETAVREAPDAEIVFSSGPAMIDHMPDLKWQCTTNAGVNNFCTVDAVRSGRVILSNSSGAYGVTIAEHIIMVLLEILRHQAEYSEIVSNRQWTRNLPIRSIFGSNVVIFGTGNIGQETAKRLRAFEPKQILGINRSGKNPDNRFDVVYPVQEADAVLSEADYVILAMPGTSETAGVLNRKRIAGLKDGAVIVNVGRGSAVDQTALKEHLEQRRLYAALDVFEQEPIPDDDTLWDCPNLLITPHVAGDTSLPYTLEVIVSMFLRDFAHYVKQEPLEKRVDVSRGY